MQQDVVNNPAHYTSGKIEVIDFITDQGLDFPRGNVVKYVARAGKKDPAKELEDLKKARKYLDFAINILETGSPVIAETKPVEQEITSKTASSPFTPGKALTYWELFVKSKEHDFLITVLMESEIERQRAINVCYTSFILGLFNVHTDIAHTLVQKIADLQKSSDVTRVFTNCWLSGNSIYQQAK